MPKEKGFGERPITHSQPNLHGLCLHNVPFKSNQPNRNVFTQKYTYSRLSRQLFNFLTLIWKVQLPKYADIFCLFFFFKRTFNHDYVKSVYALNFVTGKSAFNEDRLQKNKIWATFIKGLWIFIVFQNMLYFMWKLSTYVRPPSNKTRLQDPIPS